MLENKNDAYIYSDGRWTTDGATHEIRKRIITIIEKHTEEDFGHDKKAFERFQKQFLSHRAITGIYNICVDYATKSKKQLNTKHFLLNVKNGTIDLKTKEFYEHEPADYFTKQATVIYDPHAKCPHFQKFLREIFREDHETIAYIQRIIGYCLTGDVREQCFFIFYGGGANGKSTLLDIIRYVFGDYFSTTNSEAFMKTAIEGSKPTPEIALLEHIRLGSITETGDGDNINGRLMKTLSGEEKVTARKLHNNPSEQDITFKLIISTNHKPNIHETDDGTWRRIRLIEFGAHFYRADDPDAPAHALIQDLSLKEKLKGELSGILNWAIDGCIEWQRHGLQTPDSVKDAIAEYRIEQDVVGRFLKECCEKKTDTRVRLTDIYVKFCEWCKNNGHQSGSKQRLSKKLKDRGYGKEENSTGGNTFILGLSIKPEEMNEGYKSWIR